MNARSLLLKNNGEELFVREFQAAPHAKKFSFETRWQELDLVRGIAACLVFTYHFVGMTQSRIPGNELWDSFGAISLLFGSIGTNLLLLLSGFLIAKSLSRPDFSYVHFMNRRSLRLYVPYIVVLALACAFVTALPGFSKAHPDQSTISYFAQQLLLLPGLFPDRPMLTVSWTLSYIFAGYCFLPLLAVGYKKIFTTATGYLPLWITVLLTCLLSNLLLDAPIIRICYIPAGCILAEVVLRDQASLTSRLGLTSAFLAGLTFLSLRFSIELQFASSFLQGGMYRLCYFLCGLGAVSSFTMFAIYSSSILNIDYSMLPMRVFNFIGRRGYSFYLLHGPVTKVLVFSVVAFIPDLLGTPIANSVLMSCCLLGTMLAAQLSFYALETKAPTLLVAAWQKIRLASAKSTAESLQTFSATPGK